MTALGHLRNLLEQPCPYDDYEDCWYCRKPLDRHAADCSWVAAKEYVEGQQKADRSFGDDCPFHGDYAETGSIDRALLDQYRFYAALPAQPGENCRCAAPDSLPQEKD